VRATAFVKFRQNGWRRSSVFGRTGWRRSAMSGRTAGAVPLCLAERLAPFRCVWQTGWRRSAIR